MKLPTTPGSVIGWAFYNDGINHYGVAVLTWTDADDSDGLELRWHLAGFPGHCTEEEMLKLAHWQDLGVLHPACTLKARA